MSVKPGIRLGERYQLLSPIASGGMGQVWRAEDTTLHRVVAAKILRSEFTGDETFLARFRAEARNTASLSHPNIASVYDYGEQVHENERLCYLVMELVEGKPLVDILAKERRLSPSRTLDYLEQTALGLAAAHREGMVHRDIKPGNLIIRPDGVVKITDFGIARAANSVALTEQGTVVGTAQYLAPEQAEGQAARPASDVYALAVVGYECLAGVRPFDGDNSVAIALSQIRDAARPLPNDVPPPVRELIELTMRKNPAERYPDGAAFVKAIQAVREGQRPPRPPSAASSTARPPAQMPGAPRMSPPGVGGPRPTQPGSGVPAPGVLGPGVPRAGGPRPGGAGPGVPNTPRPGGPGPGNAVPGSAVPGSAVPGPGSPGQPGARPAPGGPPRPNLAANAVPPAASPTPTPRSAAMPASPVNPVSPVSPVGPVNPVGPPNLAKPAGTPVPSGPSAVGSPQNPSTPANPAAQPNPGAPPNQSVPPHPGGPQSPGAPPNQGVRQAPPAPVGNAGAPASPPDPHQHTQPVTPSTATGAHPAQGRRNPVLWIILGLVALIVIVVVIVLIATQGEAAMPGVGMAADAVFHLMEAR